MKTLYDRLGFKVVKLNVNSGQEERNDPFTRENYWVWTLKLNQSRRYIIVKIAVEVYNRKQTEGMMGAKVGLEVNFLN